MEKRTLYAILLIGLLSAGYFWFLNSQKQDQPRQTAGQKQEQQKQEKEKVSKTAEKKQEPKKTPEIRVRRTKTVKNLSDEFIALAPGVENYNQAVGYIGNLKRLSKTNNQIRFVNLNIKELRAKLAGETNKYKQNRIKAQINAAENRLKRLEAQKKRYSLPEEYNGVKTAPRKINFQTDKYIAEFTTKGAIFSKLLYKKLRYYNKQKEKKEHISALAKNPNVVNQKKHAFLVSFKRQGLTKNEMPVYTYDEQASKEMSNEKQQKKVFVFYVRYFNKGKIFRLTKTFTFYQNEYVIDFKVSLINESAGDNEIVAKDSSNEEEGYYVFWGKGLGQYVRKKYRSYFDEEIRLLSYNSVDDKLKEIDKDEKLEQKLYPNQAEWVGIDNRYFFVGADINRLKKMASSQATKNRYNPVKYAVMGREKQLFQEYLILSFFKIKLNGKNDKRESTIRFYLGPKDSGHIEEAGVKGMSLVDDRGWAIFRPIGSGIKWLLMKINSFVGNFGISIILLTILIKLLLHPLNKKSTESAKKMQMLQPKVKEINAQYAKDPQMKQKALMELYKKEGINPLGGCLPLLLQMPFFIAIFQTFPTIVELKDVTFLWIHDLSSPDTIAWINLFITDQLNLLPLIMTATTILSSKISAGSGGDAKQQKMMMFLPVIFLFILYKMPSGLVLYWTVQNLIQMFQQIRANKKIEQEQKEKAKQEQELAGIPKKARKSINKPGNNKKKK